MSGMSSPTRWKTPHAPKPMSTVLIAVLTPAKVRMLARRRIISVASRLIAPAKSIRLRMPLRTKAVKSSACQSSIACCFSPKVQPCVSSRMSTIDEAAPARVTATVLGR